MKKAWAVLAGLTLLLTGCSSDSGDSRLIENPNPERHVETARLRHLKTISPPADQDGPLWASITDVAVSKSGKLAVLDDKNHQISVFSDQGAMLHVFGREGQGPGEFKSPKDLLFTEQGTLAVFDGSNSRITLFALNGELLHSIDNLPYSRGSLSQDRSGRYYLSASRYMTAADDSTAYPSYYQISGDDALQSFGRMHVMGTIDNSNFMSYEYLTLKGDTLYQFSNCPYSLTLYNVSSDPVQLCQATFPSLSLAGEMEANGRRSIMCQYYLGPLQIVAGTTLVTHVHDSGPDFIEAIKAAAKIRNETGQWGELKINHYLDCFNTDGSFAKRLRLPEELADPKHIDRQGRLYYEGLDGDDVVLEIYEVENL